MTESPDQQRPKPFRVETTLDAPADRVWAALTEPEQVRQWFGWDYPGLDAEIREIFVDDGVTAGHRMTFTDDSYLELVPDGARTVIRAVLPGSLDDAGWEDLYDGVEEGWRAFFEQLRFLLEERPTGRRRTIYLTGEATNERALGLLGSGDRPWHASRHLRAAVDPDGRLLEVGSTRPLADGATGEVSLTISTYGLDDAAFQKVRDEWAARWAAVVAAPKVTTESGEVTLAG
jgi:hypothetical protein